MSSVVRSLASLYSQGLRRTVILGGGGPTTAMATAALDRRRRSSFSSKAERPETTGGGGGGSAAHTRASPVATPPRGHGGGEGTPPFSWARLAVASAVAAMAPFLQSKWATLLRIRSEVEMVKDAAETAAEVAAAAEKVSAEVAEQLPEHGRLRRAAVLVEHASKELAEEAHLALDIIHKVEQIEEDVKTMIDPIIDNHKPGNRITGVIIKKH